MARKLHLGGHMARLVKLQCEKMINLLSSKKIREINSLIFFFIFRNAPRLSLPGKLVFPSTHNSGHFSMLGLGDIVMPGLLLCFVMRYDAYKRAQVGLVYIF